MSDFLELTKQQRLDMQLKGLSPLNPDHVQEYMNNNGKIKSSITEKVERAKILIGEQAFNNMTGMNNTYASENYKSNQQQQSTPMNKEAMARKMLQEDMNNYGSSSGNVDLSSSFENFNSSPKQQQVDLKSIYKNGYDDSKVYLNSFIRTLNQSGDRIEIFKALQIILKKKQKYQSNVNVSSAYEKGVAKAEQELLQKLQK